MKHLFIGLDFGSDSVRALLVDEKGGEKATAVHYYQRWSRSEYCDAVHNRFRHHPLDYLEGMEKVIKEVLVNQDAKLVAGIAFDATCTTVCAVDRQGVPLALLPEFADDPDAMFLLWKDHTAMAEEKRINEVAASWPVDYRKYSGGGYSCEWFWSKVLHILRCNAAVRNAHYSWVELCDWIPGILSGNYAPETICRSRCAAGHKALWHKEWGGLPPEEFLTAIDPLLSNERSHLYENTCEPGVKAGNLCKEWAEKLGLPESVVIAAGSVDCHVGAVGAQVSPGEMIKVIGTSTCDVLAVPDPRHCIPGICGQVDGSVIPGLIGVEAGQSAFGDIYNWFKRFLDYAGNVSFAQLEADAAALPAGSCGVMALDWFNGRRTPYANNALSGVIAGLNLGSTVPMVYRALIESTVMGSKAILEHLKANGVTINGITAVGGISYKSELIMQMCADAFNMPIKVAKTEQSCALGSAMIAAVAAGIYPKLEVAIENMGSGYRKIYTPNAEMHQTYEELFKKYTALGKAVEFGN